MSAAVLDHLLAEFDALVEGRAYSAFLPNVTGWRQWSYLAAQGEWA